MKNGFVKVIIITLVLVVVGGALNSMTSTFINGCRNGQLDVNAVANAGIESVSDSLAIGEDINIDKEDADNFFTKAYNGITNLFGGCEERTSNLIDMDKILLMDTQ